MDTIPKLRIKEEIKLAGYTMGSFADKLGITPVALSQRCNCKPSIPNVTTLMSIADALNIPLWRLFISPEEAHEYYVQNGGNTEQPPQKIEGSQLFRCPDCGTILEIKKFQG